MQSISPGYVKTEIEEVAGIDPKLLENVPPLKVEDLAEAVIYVLSTPPHVQVNLLYMVKMVFWWFADVC